MSSIEQNLKAVHVVIQKTLGEKGLKQPVKLIAVSKTFPSGAVREAYQYGQILFGENKVQEGELKKQELRDLKIEWHLIGHLQTNKARKAAETFDMIHSIDSYRLAEKISNACKDLNKVMPILIQVNTSKEGSKSGLDPDIQIISQEIEKIKPLPNLIIKGFMTIGPLTENVDEVRKAFQTLKNIQTVLQKRFPELDLSDLSMGMSGDYPIAIEEGATYVRVGSSIFGHRNYTVS